MQVRASESEKASVREREVGRVIKMREEEQGTEKYGEIED